MALIGTAHHSSSIAFNIQSCGCSLVFSHSINIAQKAAESTLNLTRGIRGLSWDIYCLGGSVVTTREYRMEEEIKIHRSINNANFKEATRVRNVKGSSQIQRHKQLHICAVSTRCLRPTPFCCLCSVCRKIWKCFHLPPLWWEDCGN